MVLNTGVLKVSADTPPKNELPVDFECNLDLDDTTCGAHLGQTEETQPSGTIMCSVCNVVLDQSREETPDDGSQPQFSEIDDDEGEDDGNPAESSVTTDKAPFSHRTPEERIKYTFMDKLRETAQRLDLSEGNEGKELADYIYQNIFQMTAIYMELQGEKFFTEGITMEVRCWVIIILHRMDHKLGEPTNELLTHQGLPDPQKIQNIVSRARRFLSGGIEKEVIQYMRSYASPLGVSNQILEEAIQHFRDAGAPFIAKSPKARAAVWLLLTLEAATGKRFNASLAQRITKINRKTIGEVKKEYKSYFGSVKADT